MNIQHGSQMTSEEIYEDLCKKIERLEYMPGERLSENDLCKVYNVSRHVIRNALATLKGRRLVEVYPQRGTYVSLIDMEYISDILYMREAVEQEALLRAFELPEDEKNHLIDRLRKAVTTQKGLKKCENYNEEFYVLDNIFHEAILAAIGKPNIMSLISEPYIHIRRWRNYEIRSKRRMKEIVVEHEGIIEAIEKGDKVVAREKMHIHLDTVSRYSKPLKEKESQYFA